VRGCPQQRRSNCDEPTVEGVGLFCPKKNPAPKQKKKTKQGKTAETKARKKAGPKKDK